LNFEFELPTSDFRPPTSDLRLPTSDFETDALFARLDDDDAVARAGDAFNEDDRHEQPEDTGSEDGLDLWSVLYGLE
jgi:hypothetical protein